MLSSKKNIVLFISGKNSAINLGLNLCHAFSAFQFMLNFVPHQNLLVARRRIGKFWRFSTKTHSTCGPTYIEIQYSKNALVVERTEHLFNLENSELQLGGSLWWPSFVSNFVLKTFSLSF